MEKEKLTPDQAVENIKKAYELINDAIHSNHIVFTSPAPSSTEASVRKNIIHVKNLLDISLSLLRV